MSIQVRQAEPGDKEKIFAFIKTAYGRLGDYKIPARWEWEFLENPYWEEEKLPVWIAEEEDRILGQTCAMPVVLQIGEVCYPMAWSVDTIVLPECQGKGVGSLLQKANAGHHPVFMSLSMSRANRHVKKKFGSLPLPPVQVFRRYLGMTPSFVKDYLFLKTKHHASLSRLNALGFGIFKAHYLLSLVLGIPVFFRNLFSRRFKGSGNIDIIPAERFDHQADELWEKVSGSLKAGVKREAPYLNWKYVDQPELKYKIFLARRGQELCGYLVCRLGEPEELKVGYIAELLAAPGDRETLDHLLDRCLTYFRRKKAVFVEGAASMESFASLYRAWGFGKNREADPMFYTTIEDSLLRKAPEEMEWFFTRGDHDWDQINPVRLKY